MLHKVLKRNSKETRSRKRYGMGFLSRTRVEEEASALYHSQAGCHRLRSRETHPGREGPVNKAQ